MADHFKGQSEMPARKAKAFNGARDRIIKTDIKLERAGHQIRGHQQELQNWSDAFSNPIMDQFGEDVKREMAENMAEQVAEVISEAVKSEKRIFKILTATAMDKLVKLTGDNLAAIVRDLILTDATIRTSVNKDISNAEPMEVISTQIFIPSARVNVSYNIPFTPFKSAS